MRSSARRHAAKARTLEIADTRIFSVHLRLMRTSFRVVFAVSIVRVLTSVRDTGGRNTNVSPLERDKADSDSSARTVASAVDERAIFYLSEARGSSDYAKSRFDTCSSVHCSSLQLIQFIGCISPLRVCAEESPRRPIDPAVVRRVVRLGVQHDAS